MQPFSKSETAAPIPSGQPPYPAAEGNSTKARPGTFQWAPTQPKATSGAEPSAVSMKPEGGTASPVDVEASLNAKNMVHRPTPLPSTP